MTQVTQKETNPEEVYEYFNVKCEDCDAVSDQILYQNHLNGDETVKYIMVSVGYRASNEGGLRCKKCHSEYKLRSK